MTAPRPPAGLEARGRAFWRAVTTERKWDAAGLVLIGEACRMVDRLEKLDGLLRGDVATWAEIVDNYEGGQRNVYVELDAGLTEARQMQTALLGILTKLGLGKSEAAKQAGPSVADQLKAKRAERVAKAAAASRPSPA